MTSVNVLIIGAGEAGRDLYADIASQRKTWNCIGFLDDGMTGDDILGTISDLDTILDQQDVGIVIFSIPRVKTERIFEVRRSCRLHSVSFLILPPKLEVFSSGAKVSMLRELDIADVLGKSFSKIEAQGHIDFYKDKVVVVFGAAGSIGSELFAQLAQLDVKKVIGVDIHELGVFTLQSKYKDNDKCEFHVVDMKDADMLATMFSEYDTIDTVFHAAAYKHVPLMEKNIETCIKNNVIGTENIFRACADAGVRQLVFVSSDKAVRPLNVMGATKRVSEKVISKYNTDMCISSVRFGNVLNSSGSVVQVFTDQIANGNYVSVTDERMQRYFMTIEEAVFLILESAKFQENGKIYLLDMGEMIRIVDLAEKVIKIHGYEPNKEVGILFSGIRPGEKLKEDLYYDIENMTPCTENDKIFEIDECIVTDEQFFERYEHMKQQIHTLPSQGLKALLIDICN